MPFVNHLAAATATTQEYGVTAMSGPGNLLNTNWRFGVMFTVGGSSLTVNQLRAYFMAADTLRVIIHRVSDSVNLAELDITNGSSGWATSTLGSNITLAAGTQYIVSARVADGTSMDMPREATTLTYNTSFFTVDEYRRTGSAVDTMPTTTYPVESFWADFGFLV